MDTQSPYRKVSVTIDILCLVGFPIGLGIAINYVLGICVFAIIAIVTVLRRRFLDDKAEKLVVGAVPRYEGSSEKIDGRPVLIMVSAAALVTVAPIVSLIIHLGAGEGFPTWLIGCIAMIWFGVAMVAVGRWLARRSQ
jgi:hypothetical protein